MLILAAFAAKGVLSVEFDCENIAFIACSHLCTVQTEGTVRCATLVRHVATGLDLAAARTIRPSVAPERVLGCALSMAWYALPVINT